MAWEQDSPRNFACGFLGRGNDKPSRVRMGVCLTEVPHDEAFFRERAAAISWVFFDFPKPAKDIITRSNSDVVGGNGIGR